ncbi:hypothetical protein [Candidatus Magnetominusculus xianensis]|uniref:Secreted protein n=1 Tax=Candidatus Magnetominusculus xianensis TaxID=1748249 RepID=A0ABR5SKW9_9BACT|nr:hypothetical protein [Candidatus Magnetominusculus xianensis]KWT95139.1 hypothetical protein ASN18_0067 [Candidatus Magnetominusculus xianensis]MBF0402786.1 hypothetical protein [Nitrospirota bacterium]
MIANVAAKTFKTILFLLAVAALGWYNPAICDAAHECPCKSGVSSGHQYAKHMCPKAGGQCQHCKSQQFTSIDNTTPYDCPMHKHAAMKIDVKSETDYKAAMTSIVYLYKMEADLLEAVGKGFSSVKSPKEREDFYRKMIIFNRIALWLYETSILKGNVNTQILFNRLYTIKKYIEDDMMHLMDEYPKTHKVDPSHVLAIRGNTAKTVASAEELIALILKDTLPAAHDPAVQAILSFAQFFVLTAAEIEEVYAYTLAGKSDIAENYHLLSAKANAAADAFKKEPGFAANVQMIELYTRIINDKIDLDISAGKIVNKASAKPSAGDTFAKSASSVLLNMGKMMDLLITNAREKVFSR